MHLLTNVHIPSCTLEVGSIDVLVAPGIRQTSLCIDTNLGAVSPTRELQHKKSILACARCLPLGRGHLTSRNE